LVSLALILGFILSSSTQAENIGWWKFDEGSGSTAFDTSGNDHHADILGTPEWVVGPPGFSGALDFTNTRGAKPATSTRQEERVRFPSPSGVAGMAPEEYSISSPNPMDGI
jgi:hypothetical protein